MKLPLQITFRNVDHSEAVETKIRERAEKLDVFHKYIMSCRISVESRHRHKHQGNLFHVRLDVKVPERELVASREPDEHHAYEDVYVTIRDVFEAMERQLRDYADQQQRQVKAHAEPSYGTIAELRPDEDYGRVEMPDGRLIYFHRNSLVGADFGQLQIGAQVRLSEEMGEQGPQASSVHLV